MEEENKTTAEVLEKPKHDRMLPLSILMAAVLISGSVIYSVSHKSGVGGQANLPGSGNDGANVDSSVKIESDDVVLGDPKAPVTIIEFGDYQCPFCGKFFKETEPLIRENYIKTGKVKMVWRDFAFLGPESLSAAEAAHCSADQNKYWEYHDALMTEEIRDGSEHNGNLNEVKFKELAKNLGMNVDSFSGCISLGKYKSLVKKLYDSAVELGVNSTPTLFINGRKVQGALPYSSFKTLIEAELKK